MGKDFPDSNIVGDYILRKKLRETSLSTVWKADHTTTGEAVALKQIAAAKLTSHLRNCLDCELAFLSSVNHPNIIRLLDFFQCQEFIILIMEFCEGGDLASFIRRHGRVQERLAKRFMQQLGAGLQVLKQNHIVHRDLKPELLQNIKESTSLPFTPSILPQLHPDCVDLCSRLLSICPGLSYIQMLRLLSPYTSTRNSLIMLSHSLTVRLSLQMIVCPLRNSISTIF